MDSQTTMAQSVLYTRPLRISQDWRVLRSWVFWRALARESRRLWIFNDQRTCSEKTIELLKLHLQKKCTKDILYL